MLGQGLAKHDSTRLVDRVVAIQPLEFAAAIEKSKRTLFAPTDREAATLSPGQIAARVLAAIRCAEPAATFRTAPWIQGANNQARHSNAADCSSGPAQQ